MKFFTAALFAAALFTALPAAADDQDLDMSALKCKDFVSLNQQVIGSLLAWLEGYYTKPDAKPILSPSKMLNDAKGLAQYCKDHGDDGLIKAADTVMPRK